MIETQTTTRTGEPGRPPEASGPRRSAVGEASANLLYLCTEAAARGTHRDRAIHEVLLRSTKRERAGLAADPLCPTAVLRHLVIDRPVVQTALAGNPVFVAELLPGIVRAADWDALLEDRAGREGVRIVAHPNCPAALQEYHLEEHCWFDPVRWLAHPQLPEADVREVIGSRRDGILEALMRRENVGSQQIEVVVAETDHRLAASPVRGPVPVQRRDLTRRSGPAPLWQRRLRILLRALARPECPGHRLAERAAAESRSVRLTVARNPALPARAAGGLVARDGLTAARALAGNPRLGPEQIDEIVALLIEPTGDRGVGIRTSAGGPGGGIDASGPAGTRPWLTRVLLQLLQHDRCSQRTVRRLVDHRFATVRAAARARDQRTGAAELVELGRTAPRHLADDIAGHPNATLEALIGVLPHGGTWARLVDHVELTPSVLVRLLRDRRPVVRELAFDHVAGREWPVLRAVLLLVGARARTRLLRAAGETARHRACSDPEARIRFVAARFTGSGPELTGLGHDSSAIVRREASRALVAAMAPGQVG